MPLNAAAVRAGSTTVFVGSPFRLLVVEPDGAAAAELTGQPQGHGLSILICEDPAEALLLAGSMRPDAVLTAAELPFVDSVTLTRVLHRRTGIPVIVGVGTQDRESGAAAIAAGATAWVSRPYQLPELLTVLRSIGADRPVDVEPVIECGNLRLDPAALTVHLDGRPVRLPPREFQLLRLLMLNAARVVTRESIRRTVWADGETGGDSSNTITVHIQRLRSRLGGDPRNAAAIVTVRGIGYRLVPPARP
jgi:DNA-binding response OmpR family regulator